MINSYTKSSIVAPVTF